MRAKTGCSPCLTTSWLIEDADESGEGGRGMGLVERVRVIRGTLEDWPREKSVPYGFDFSMDAWNDSSDGL